MLMILWMEGACVSLRAKGQAFLLQRFPQGLNRIWPHAVKLRQLSLTDLGQLVKPRNAGPRQRPLRWSA
jgi:hypothetical protein